MRTDRCGSSLRIEASQGKRLDALCKRFLSSAVYTDDLLGLGIISVANILIGIGSISIPIEVCSQVRAAWEHRQRWQSSPLWDYSQPS